MKRVIVWLDSSDSCDPSSSILELLDIDDDRHAFFRAISDYDAFDSSRWANVCTEDEKSTLFVYTNQHSFFIFSQSMTPLEQYQAIREEKLGLKGLVPALNNSAGVG